MINIPAVLTGGITDASAPETLLKNNQAVRAVVRDPQKGGGWAAQGCEIALAEMELLALRRQMALLEERLQNRFSVQDY